MTALPRRTLAAYAALSVTCAFVPLFDLLAFEFAFVSAVPLTLHLGLAAARGHSLGDLARTLCAAVLGLLVPICLNGLRVPNCNWAHGFGFFALLPLWGACVAVAAGRACAALSPARPASAFVAAWGGAALWAIAAFWWGPAVDAFSPFLGYYPGSLYDEVIALDARLVASRAEDLCVAVCVWAWSARAPRLRRLTASLAAVGAIGLAFRFDVHRPALIVERALGGESRSPGFRLVFPREWDPSRVEALNAELAFVGETLDGFFGGPPKGETTVYLYRSAREKKRLMGAGNVRIAKPWQHAVHLHDVEVGDAVLMHELAHVWSTRLNPAFHALSLTPWGLPNMGLIEGVAVAATWDEGALDAHTWTAAMRALEVDTPLPRLFSPTGFLTTASRAAYTQCGSFVRWLRDTHGVDTVATLYQSGALNPLDEAEVETWQAFVDARPLDANALAQARLRFDRPAIFRKTCAHEVAAVRARAERALARGALDRAMAQVDLWLGHVPHDLDALLMRLALLFDLDRFDEARSLATALLETPGMGLARSAQVHELVADLDAASGARPVTALAQAYATLRDDAFDRGTMRRLAVKSVAAASGPRGAPILKLLNGPDALRSERLRALLDAEPRASDEALDWTIRYLLARHAASLGACHRSEARLSGLAAAPHWSLGLEAERLRAQCAFSSGQYLEAQALFERAATTHADRLQAGEVASLKQWSRRAAAFARSLPQR